ncbi:MAG: hypothetical protein EOP45_05910 [Sphingobacteriaceae bacterium]|nr:MAG: hypothetical protein EOP45_05910 [Sphingobacteriaceae bacterium]
MKASLWNHHVKKVIFLFSCLYTIAANVLPAHADDIDKMRFRWVAFLTGQNANALDVDVKASVSRLNVEVEYYWKQLNKDSSANAKPWADLSYTYSKDITTSYRRLDLMALAYSTKHGKLYHNAPLKEAILKTMQWLYINQYNEIIPLPIPQQGSDIHNWWDYKIGTPLEINNIVILLYDEMEATNRNQYMGAIKHFTPDFTDAYTRKPTITQFTAANRVWVSTVLCLQGIILKDSAQISFASTSLTPVFQYTETEDGFYRDGSFIQHVKHPYTGGYGISLLGRLSEEIYLLYGSPWQLKDPSTKNIYSWIYDSFEPIIYNGNVMSMVEGREISRPDAEGSKKGVLVAQALALLSNAAPLDDAEKVRKILKYWFKDDQFKHVFFDHMSLSYITIIKRLETKNDTVIPSAPYLYKQFPHMDRVIQKTPEYAFAVSMHSARIYNYETRTNYENIKGWHTGDGQSYLYNTDKDQFNDNFWATVNYYHLPGTTVENQTRIPGFKNSKKNWVGGVSLSGRYGVSGMELAPAGQSLTAKKSWFMFDGKIIALGAGITNQDSAEVNTYIEQRKLTEKDTNTFMINGEVMPQSFGSDNAPLIRKDVQWAYLSGNISGADIGYYFPERITLNATRAKQLGAWKDVNVNYSSKVYTHTYLTLWKNQGNEAADLNKDNNKYAYVLLPGFTASQTKTYAAKPDIKIIENTARLQAVKSESLNIIAANFWLNVNTALNLNDLPAYISCNTQAAVMVQKKHDTLKIAISDPTMLHNIILLTLKEKTKRVIFQDPTVQVISMEPLTKLSVDVTKLGGRTVTVTFATK